MFYVSHPLQTAPIEYKSALQEKVYAVLEALEIPYERVDTDEAITMEDCVTINKCLNMKMVKTLFLCNRQQTHFYLFITTGDKPFRSKDFSLALGISRLSFAPPDIMEQMIGTKIGSATVFSLLLETSREVQIVFDNEVIKEEWYGCSDGTTTGYMKIKTSDVLHKLIPYTKHIPLYIEI